MALRITVPRNCVTEVSLTAAAVYADPWHDVDVDVVVEGPGGPWRIPAFWAGDQTWRFRFAGPREGAYTFTTAATAAGDTGLHGIAGAIDVTPYQGTNPLHQHGRLRVAPDRRHFTHEDGSPFFWLADTWWMGLSTRLDWPHGFRELAADRLAKGFNVIQIVGGPYPDMPPFDPRNFNEAGYPFTEEYGSIRPEYYNLAALRIACLVEMGLMPCIVGMWGYYLPWLGVEKATRYWRYLVARYGAYPVAWCIAGEGTMPYYLSPQAARDAAFQKSGWTEVMASVRQTDPFRNPICIHPTRYGYDQVTDPAQMDFEMLQTGHSDMDSVGPTIESVTTAVGRTPAMPVVNGEVNYEGILGRAWENVQRLCFYHSVLNGTAGHTYGANGIWQMNQEGAPYGPSPHGRCWGNTPWREASQLSGSRQLGLGAQFVRSFPWWQWERHPEWTAPAARPNDPYGTIAVGIPRQLRLYYAPLAWNAPEVKALEADVAYTAWYFNPRSGGRIDLGPAKPDAEGNWNPPLPPEVHDWLLVLEARG